MKKFAVLAVLLLSSFLLFSCASNKVEDNTLVDGKVQSEVTLEQLNSLKKDNIREAETLEKLDSTATYGFDSLNELEFSIICENQKSFNEGFEKGYEAGYEAGKRDATESLKEQGLYKEEEKK